MKYLFTLGDQNCSRTNVGFFTKFQQFFVDINDDLVIFSVT